MTTSSFAELDALVARVKKAQEEFANYTQQQVDDIFRAAALAAYQASQSLAEQAVEESEMGIIQDKIIKNQFASEYVYEQYKDEKTCDIIEENSLHNSMTIADPVGVICGVIPTTNPTSTAIFKSLISLKTRNGIIFSPHPRAKESTNRAASVVLEAAVAAGAPEGIIGWVDKPSVELSNALMTHQDISLILATGGPGMVKAAYSSGKPALGVGAGNVPVVIDESADIEYAVESIIKSKTFDNGVVCASEQAAIVVEGAYESVKRALEGNHCYILSENEAEKVRSVLRKDGCLNPNIVGQSAYEISLMAGINVPVGTKVLVGEGLGKVNVSDAFAHEKLSPTLGLFKADSFEDAVEQAVTMVELGGIGHTSGMYTNQTLHPDRVRYFGQKMKTVRILVNTPTSQGAIGGIYNTIIPPSLTLGCGTWGGNSISENVGPKHLINKKIVAAPLDKHLMAKKVANSSFADEVNTLATGTQG
ncbi:aldehyde dehydrogenase family protein [Vibrio astriarenae]|uniref:Aldehyde dehydrogenase family protein n=1 Tax=Vibrio astriarenae TaxID=1481923 RepID=A0A7Z2YDT6_9VIBR|nr:aldehyde dehydrogenase family protein [Vibrio astriarenae]